MRNHARNEAPRPARSWAKGCDRRAFLGRSLAVAASMSTAARAVSAHALAESQSPFQAVEINHLALDTPDNDGAVAFYENQFGMTNVSHGRVLRDTFLHFAHGFLNTGAAMSAGMNHFCLGIENFTPDDVFRRLESLGLKPFRMGGGPLVHVHDPDGLNLQIQEIAHGYGRTPASQLTRAKTGLFETDHIHRVSIGSTDVPRSRDFYVKMFGLSPAEGGDDQHCVLRLKQGFVEFRKADRPRIDHFCLAVRPFDADEAAAKLKEAKIEAVATDEPRVIMMRDANGLLVQALPIENA